MPELQSDVRLHVSSGLKGLSQSMKMQPVQPMSWDPTVWLSLCNPELTQPSLETFGGCALGRNGTLP